jgi:hypothetical protein
MGSSGKHRQVLFCWPRMIVPKLVNTSKETVTMAIIKTPGAGVSPYETATDTPTVLRAGADGTTVLAAAATAATGANTSVYVSGQAALNSLITTSQSGVFEGANVTINLEEQNFNTTNQVVSTTNYPAGSEGEIQYNSGSNSFSSSAYFTYASGNVITPGIRTDNYLYANGAPFLAGGNAAIGNFVFTGDNMTIGHANSALNINGNGTGNVNISANSKTWTFDANGNATFPTGGLISNYPGGIGANNDSWFVTPGSGTGGVSSQDGQQYIQINNNLYVEIGTSYGTANASVWQFGQDGNFGAPGNISTNGNISGAYILGNGSQLTGINVASISNGNSNINIATANGNVTVTAAGTNTWTFDSGGNLIFPSNAEITVDNTGAAVFQHEGGVTIAETNGNSFVYNTVIELFDNAVHLGTNQQGNAYSWDFSQDGSLSVPGNITGANVITANVFALSQGGNITAGAIPGGALTGNTITLTPGGGTSANQQLLVYPTVDPEADANHLHLTSGNLYNTELFLGNDSLYVKLANTGNIVINSNDDVGNAAQWTFRTDGNLTLPAAGNIVGAANIIGNGAGNVNVNANSRVWTFAADGSLVLPLAGNIVNYGNVWTFGYDGNLTFPTGNLVIIPDDAAEANAAFIRSTDHVIALLSTGVNGGAQSVWIQDVANIGTSNTAAVRVSPISQIGNVQIQTGNNSSINTWNFGYDGNLVLPGNVIAINYANGNRVTGNITFRDEIVIGTGTSNLISGLYLAPSSSSADASMYLRVRGNITDEPTHIHFDTGNNAYYNQFIGDDNKYIQLANTGNIVINSNDGVGNAAQWNFDVNGVLTVPGEGIINSVDDTVVLRSFNTTTGNANSVYLGTSGGLGFSDQAIGANWLEIFRSGTEPQIQTTVGNLLIQTTSNSTPYNWNFGNTGNLTVPGSIILPANSLITGAAASPAPSLNGFNSVSAVDLSASGNVTAAIVSATGNIIGNTAGFAIGYLNVPQVSFSGNATIAATDAGKHYYSTLSTANVLTIANNTSVTWAVGTAISLVNRGTGNITVAQGTGVSLYLAGNATAGNRTVATYGMATLLNVAANIWMINGTGVS